MTRFDGNIILLLSQNDTNLPVVVVRIVAEVCAALQPIIDNQSSATSLNFTGNSSISLAITLSELGFVIQSILSRVACYNGRIICSEFCTFH